jgi:hypothetical protein
MSDFQSLRSVVIVICRITAKLSLTCPVACLGKTVLIAPQRAYLCLSDHSACKHSRKTESDAEKTSDGGVERLLVCHWELLLFSGLLSFSREVVIPMMKVSGRSWSAAGRFRWCFLLSCPQARWDDHQAIEERPCFQHTTPAGD